ncbi:MAG: EAL domain-containing protein [Synechocystis sp.]|nr:EAL domain-containing protein [Synechocystis sp.]
MFPGQSRIFCPVQRLLPPQAFLDKLQKSRLLGALDRLVVTKAIAVLREQSQVVLAVNLSDVTLGDRDFLVYLQEQLRDTNIDPKRLGFELPEMLIQPHNQTQMEWLQALRKLGCWVTVDSCTGKRFSLQDWQCLPVDRVKLDRQLVAQFEERETQTLAIALVKVNQLFKRPCIAKGIDNQTLLNRARRLGVQEVQGYYLRTPQRKPHLLLSSSLLGTGFVSLLVLLYLFKSFLGINLFPQEHAWQVIWKVITPLWDYSPESRPSPAEKTISPD